MKSPLPTILPRVSIITTSPRPSQILQTPVAKFSAKYSIPTAEKRPLHNLKTPVSDSKRPGYNSPSQKAQYFPGLGSTNRQYSTAPTKLPLANSSSQKLQYLSGLGSANRQLSTAPTKLPLANLSSQKVQNLSGLGSANRQLSTTPSELPLANLSPPKEQYSSGLCSTALGSATQITQSLIETAPNGSHFAVQSTPSSSDNVNLSMTKAELKQLVKEEIEKNPVIIKMDKRIARILHIVEYQNSYENKKISYLPVATHDMLNRLENIMKKNEKEQERIVSMH
jgi:hypothetical protein